MKELGLGTSWIVLEDDLMSLEKEPGVIRDLYLVSLGAGVSEVCYTDEIRWDDLERRRHAFIRRFDGIDDVSTGVRVVPQDVGQR